MPMFIFKLVAQILVKFGHAKTFIKQQSVTHTHSEVS